MMQWETVEPSIWHVFDQEAAEGFQHGYYCLSDGDLYRAEGLNKLTNARATSKYSDKTKLFQRDRSTVFSQYHWPNTTPPKDIAFPLTPEQQNEKWQQLQSKASLYTGFVDNIESPFSAEQRDELIYPLPSSLIDFDIKNYPNPDAYLTALHDVIYNDSDKTHMALIHQAARTVDCPSLKSTNIDQETLFVMKKNFLFDLLTHVYNYIRQQFGLNLDATIQAEQAPIPAQENPAQIEIEALVTEEESAPLPTNELPAIQRAVASAQQKYLEWYKGEQPHRGANGFFSWARHGAYGQTRAHELHNKIQLEKDCPDAIEHINHFLTQGHTRYHRHSFASFLLDELKAIPLSPWSELTHGITHLYDKNTVIKSLEIRM